jgi:hypothetical protein
MKTCDKKFYDATLSFYINQLDELDKRLYEPLIDVTYGRDIKLRTDVSFANESTSFIQSTFGGIGTQNATGLPWLAPNANTIPGVSVDGQRVVTPLRLLATAINYTSVELEKSQLLGQPIDTQKFTALNIMQQQGTDQMVYIGDTSPTVQAYGLVNSPLVTSASVPADGAGGSTTFASKTREQITRDVNDLLNATYLASGYAICPDKLLIESSVFANLAGRPSGESSDKSILQYLKENNICTAKNGVNLDIQPLKFLTGIGAGATNRMVAYTNDESRVRFPMVPIRRETTYYQGITFTAPYIWAFGEVEFVYPETVQYADGI